MRYPDLPPTLLELEEATLLRWRGEDLFHETLRATENGDPFVFYEGPPTANGRPGLHHIIGRTLKDLVCRYWSMRGRRVTRIAGWDTHGLPVEIEAEKQLGISGKPQIEEVGIARFNDVCRDSVFTYKEDWENLSERIAYWLDYENPYVTFHASYIESVWWILAELADRGLLYRGHKSVPYCPRCGTALSSHEVAQGYKDVEDPSLFFLAPLLDENGAADPEGRALVVWTTTPWTVPSNTALALHPLLVYAAVEQDGRRLIVAKDLVDSVFGEGARIVDEYRAEELEGARYARPLDLVPRAGRFGCGVDHHPRRLRECRGRYRHRAHGPRVRGRRLRSRSTPRLAAHPSDRRRRPLSRGSARRGRDVREGRRPAVGGGARPSRQPVPMRAGDPLVPTLLALRVPSALRSPRTLGSPPPRA